MNQLATNLIVAALLVGLVLLIRKPVARIFGAHAAYALWLVPGLRLVMPPLPAWSGAEAAPSAVSAQIQWALMIEPVADAASSQPLWLWLWGAGAAIFLGWQLINHHLFLRRALRSGRPYRHADLDVDAVITPAVEGPAATGLIHPLILLPDDFATRFTPEQQRIALLHESLHHRRGDIWASAAALVGASALWFSPLTWLALGAFRRDMESACDSSVLAADAPVSAASYGETILRSAARPVPRSLCALTSLDELKGRLTMLNANHGTTLRMTGIGLVGTLALAGLAISAPARADEPKKETRVEKRIIVHSSGGDQTVDWSEKDGTSMKTDCPGALTVIEAGTAGTEQKKEKAKIVVCSKTANKADIAKGLETALANVEKNDDMEAGMKAEIVAKLKAAIAEAKAG